MSLAAAAPQTALKYETEVQEEGRIELQSPFSAGERVVVIVINEAHPQSSAPSGDEALSQRATTAVDEPQRPPFPVMHLDHWPADVPGGREELYDDRGR